MMQERGSACWFCAAVLRKPRIKGDEEAEIHSVTPISRHTPPSMARDCPGTVPDGNLDMCVCRKHMKTHDVKKTHTVKRKRSSKEVRISVDLQPKRAVQSVKKAILFNMFKILTKTNYP